MHTPLLSSESNPSPSPRGSRSASYASYTDPDVPPEPLVVNTASSLSCYSNLTNTIIGSGVLGLPYALSKCGWILGTCLLVLSACFSTFSLHLLTKCAMKVPQPCSFYSVTEATIPRLTFMIDFAVAILCFGVAISYLIVIGGLMPDVMSDFNVNGYWSNRTPWIILGFCVVAPLSAMHRLDALKYTSGLSICFVAFLTIMVVVFAVPNSGADPCSSDDDDDDDGECRGDRQLATLTVDTMRVFSIFVFAFACQTNIFGVVNELRNPTQTRYDIVSGGAIATAAVIYSVVACAGYATYGDNVEDNILINYPNNTLTSVARIFVSLLVAFSYPVIAHPARSCILGLWRSMDKEEDSWIKYNKVRYITITVCFLGGTLLTAILTDSLGVILALVGATGATIIVYILPGASYCVMFYDYERDWKWYASAVLVGLGIVIGPVCLAFIFV